MNRSSTLAVAALLLLAGCAGTRTPKLARCAGPYRYANPYGTVLPTLPIPGQMSPAPPVPPPAASTSASGAVHVPDAAEPPPPPAPPPSAGHPEPDKTSGLMPTYPSC